MNREAFIQAGAQALLSADPDPDEMAGCLSLSEDVIDAVEHLIRADEREQTAEALWSLLSPIVDWIAGVNTARNARNGYHG